MRLGGNGGRFPAGKEAVEARNLYGMSLAEERSLYVSRPHASYARSRPRRIPAASPRLPPGWCSSRFQSDMRTSPSPIWRLTLRGCLRGAGVCAALLPFPTRVG